MNPTQTHRRNLCAPLLALLVLTCSVAADAPPLQFTVTYSDAVCDTFTGRAYVMLSPPGRQEPRFGPSWFGNTPIFAVDVADWQPGEPLIFDDSAIGFPGKVSELPAGEYAVQAVMRRNVDSPEVGTGPGTAFSTAQTLDCDGSAGGAVRLHIDQIVQPQPFEETPRIKLAGLRSDLLSEFHGRDIIMRATIILPETYDPTSNRKYPAFYWIGGFGSTHRVHPFILRMLDSTGYSNEIVRIILDPSCYGGHHVFADSDNNGPRGTALITELIPYLEAGFPLAGDPDARFLCGHSSGGWSSLWLQITYPEFFGGTWSIAPDPVDFHSFQNIDLYAPAPGPGPAPAPGPGPGPGVNMYVDEAGNPRPIARQGTEPMLWYEPFAKMEVVVGEGGQLRSFEWVFSERGADGLPRPLYDRETGAVDPEVAASWRRYDINHILATNWDTLGPKLSGKINVFMGDLDTFYLNGATENLKQTLESLGSDAVIEIEPGRNHTNISTPELRKRIDREMIERFEETRAAR